MKLCLFSPCRMQNIVKGWYINLSNSNFHPQFLTFVHKAGSEKLESKQNTGNQLSDCSLNPSD